MGAPAETPTRADRDAMSEPIVAQLVRELRELEQEMRAATPTWVYDQRDERDVLAWADRLASLLPPEDRS